MTNQWLEMMNLQPMLYLMMLGDDESATYVVPDDATVYVLS
jgi:hypothetical protein